MTSAAEQLLRRAEGLLEVDRPADAVPLLQQVLAERPDPLLEAQALAQLSTAFVRLGRGAQALEAADRLVGLVPDLAPGHLARSLALQELDRPAEAVAAAGLAVRADPDEWAHHAQYAQLAVGVREASGDALRAARTAVQLAPTEPQAHLVLGLVAAAQARPEESDAAYRRVLELDPGNAAARSNLAAGAGPGARLGAQVDAYAGALALDPSLDPARANLERVAVVALRRAFWACVLVLVVCLLAAAQGATLLRAVVGGVALVALAAAAGRLWRRTPEGVRRFLLDRVRRQRFLRSSLVLTGLALLATAWAAFAPVPEDFVPWVLRPLGVAGVVLLVADVARRD